MVEFVCFWGLEAAFLWVIVLGIYWDKANAAGAISSMVVGLSSYVLLTQFGIKLFGFNAIVPALVFGLIAFILGNQFGTKIVKWTALYGLSNPSIVYLE